MNIRQKVNDFRFFDKDMPIMHGKTEIVLKNVKTGLVERFNDENTFQGGYIARYLNDMKDSNDGRNIYGDSTMRMTPYKGIIGGLLLFKNQIDTATSVMPAGNIMIGKGAADIVNMSDPSEMGSFNSAQSSYSGGTITQIWEFTTNQANGDINCVCLTSKEGGIVGYGNSNGKINATNYSDTLGMMYKTSGSSEEVSAKGLYSENGKRYSFTFVEGVLTVTETYTCGITKGSVFAGLSKTYTHDLSSETALVTFFGSNPSMLVDYCGNNIIRMFPTDKSVASLGTVYYIEYDTSAHTATAKSFTNGSSSEIYLASSYYNSEQGGFTQDGYFMGYINSTPYAPVFINISNGNVAFDGTSALTALGATHNRHGILQIAPKLYAIKITLTASNIRCLALVDLENETIKPIDARDVRGLGGGAYSYVRGATSCNSGYYQTRGYSGSIIQCPITPIPMYLATINNLQNTVPKTSAKTMKVTYTLTEE